MKTLEKEPRSSALERFDFERIEFGKQPTDHIFIAEFRDGTWQDPRIEKFQPFTLSPLALCLHYGQTVFEGMKAFRQQDGRIQIFRMEKHFNRFNKSLDRLCMPLVDRDLFYNALESLVRIDQDWLPDKDGISLYIRPFVIATEPRLGVKISDEYIFAVVCTPMSSYFDKPVKVKVETRYTRAAPGGTGYAKCGGNYGAAFYPTQKAREEGYDQVIWTDAKTHTYLEEAGMMNIMLIRSNKLITPLAGDSILDGVTRDSLLHIARDQGMEVEERPISITEIAEAFSAREQIEIFGCGTAAVISPIRSIGIEGVEYFPYHEPDARMFRLSRELDGIRKGAIADKFGWCHFV